MWSIDREMVCMNFKKLTRVVLGMLALGTLALEVSDNGQPPITRYARVILTVD